MEKNIKRDERISIGRIRGFRFYLYRWVLEFHDRWKAWYLTIIRRVVPQNTNTILPISSKSHDQTRMLKVIFGDSWKERNGENQFKHKNLMKAINSLNRNSPWLFTFQKYPKLSIQNATNSCDGSFTHWKEKVALHCGLIKERRLKIIYFILSQNSDSISSPPFFPLDRKKTFTVVKVFFTSPYPFSKRKSRYYIFN